MYTNENTTHRTDGEREIKREREKDGERERARKTHKHRHDTQSHIQFVNRKNGVYIYIQLYNICVSYALI